MLNAYNVEQIDRYFKIIPLCQLCCRFIVAFIYFGIQINIGKFGGDLYLNFLINVIAETVGCAFVFLLKCTGRRPLYLGTMFLLGIICLTTLFTVTFLDKCKISLQFIIISQQF